MAEDRDDVLKLRAVLDSAAESIIKASEENILDDVRSEGSDPQRLADEVRGLIQLSVKARGQKRLRAARGALNRDRKAVASRVVLHSIPKDPNERRFLLDRLIAQRADLPQALTLAFREGEAMTDDDDVSILEDLATLGYLEGPGDE